LARECEGCRKKKLLQRRAGDHAEPTEVPSIVHEVLRSPGQPLDPATRAFFEPRFGHDFSRVRVHTDARAAESARAVNALAYTVGRKIVFGAGRYMPETSDGRQLLAHEFVHVVQQSGGNVSAIAAFATIEPSDRFEAEADTVARNALSGDSISIRPSGCIPAFQRQAVGSRGTVPLRGTGARVPTEGPWYLRSHPTLGPMWYNLYTNTSYATPPSSKSLTVLDWGTDWNEYNVAGGVLRIGEIEASNVREMVDRIKPQIQTFPEAECIDDLTIVGHGAPGGISVGGGVTFVQGSYIGRGLIDPQSPEYSASIRTALSELTPLFCNTANVTLRGCNVGQGFEGAEFVRLLAELWRVPVRAPVGLTRAGGLWVEGVWQWGIPRGGSTPEPRIYAGQVKAILRESTLGDDEELIFDLLERARERAVLEQVVQILIDERQWEGVETELRGEDTGRLDRLLEGRRSPSPASAP